MNVHLPFTATRHMLPSGSKGKADLNSEDHKTLCWWVLLSGIAVCNICMWLWTYSLLTKDSFYSAPDDHPYQCYHLVLSGIYVFVCAYRSFFPRIDLERYCLFDTWMSSIFLARTAATIAEIHFSAQSPYLLYHLGHQHGHPITQNLALALVPVITIAQMFCWCGVVTLNHVYHAIEESIWAVSSAFIGLSLASFAIYHPENPALYQLGVIGSIASVLFFAFMVTVDVPMYLARWRHGKKVGRKLMSSNEGRKDALHRRVVTKSWKVWEQETVWLTGYFSSAVWLSLLFVHMAAP
eukprot:CAMPEP_0198303384 /NCGR_PEP_ID=MMETSP1449-20131203/56858_1 /TAXON_ID=420275 /ORGANISM="Attheya septentrionalis, Strain CCMP2084" /LENGTH=294 /DNA_ID=CAMNT_0044005877 /DNA_START=89 /DNA_END=974 /DNA_ORIENTATION=+